MYNRSGKRIDILIKVLRKDLGEMKIVLAGTGSKLPSKVLTNDDLARIVDTSDEWISQRTGIKQRRIVDENENLVSLSYEAAKEALKESKIEGKDLGLIVVGTSTPDKRFPNTACEIQALLGVSECVGIDVSAACSGFVYALSVAYSMMNTLDIKNALVVGGDVLSRELDWSDRSTCVLFGDGAGAAVLKKEDGESGFISFDIGSDGGKGAALYDNAYGEDRFIKMDGQEVFKFTIRTVPLSIENAIKKAGVTKEDINLFILHQANLRILEAVSKKLDIPMEKLPHNLENTGNTSGGSIPILLDEVIKKGMAKKGDLILLCGFGAGLTWGSCVLKL